MTKPRQPRHLAVPPGVHPDDVWRPGEKARMTRRLLARLAERWTPEMREEYQRLREVERPPSRRRSPERP